MKFSRLLVLSALCLTTTGAMADIVNGVRQRPAATTETEWQLETTYYLYNVQARRFFVGGNDWNTRASIAPNGYKVRFHDPADAAPEPGVVEIQDSVETKSAWLCTFATNDGGAIWVDNSTETYRFWNIGMMDNGTFRISNIHLASVAENIQGCYLGWNGSENDTRLYFVDPSEDDAAVLWAFVSEANYQAYQETWNAMKDQFEKAAELLTYIEQAKGMNIDVATWQAVYENEAATVEELDAAILAIQKAIADAMGSGASVDDPKDMTGSILNPNFDNASYDGWKGTAPNMTGDGNHALANVAEHFNKTFDTYQELSGMPSGVYLFENTGFLRGWYDDFVNHTNYTAFLYTIADGDTLQVAMVNPWEAQNTEPMAGATEFGTTAYESSEEHDGLTYYVPNDPSAARLYFEKGYYKNKVFFSIDNGTVKLGVKKGVNRSNEWAVFDNFKLTYFGGAAEAYQYWVNQSPKTEYSENEILSGAYLDAYKAAFSVTVSNKAEAIAAMKNIQNAADSLNKNIALWKELFATFENVQQYTIGQYTGLESVDVLNDALMDVEDKYFLTQEVEQSTRTQTNDDLRAVIARLKALAEDVITEYKNKLPDNTDVTEYMKSPDFEDGKGGGTTAGWTVESKGGGNVRLGGNADNHCFEAWHSTNFDVWQEVANLPVGVYEVQVSGYVRYLDGQDAIAAKETEPENVPIYVYMNDSKTNLVSWFSYPQPEEFYTNVSGATYLADGDGWCYPDNMTAASAAFTDGGYKQSAKGLVAKKGDVLRIGVKGTPEAKFWPIFDDFHLIYLGFDISVVKPVLEETIAQADNYTSLFSTKSAKAAFDAAYNEAIEAYNISEEGAEMFAALSKLTKAITDLQDGNALCVELENAVNGLMAAAEQSQSPVAAEALQYGGEIYTKLTESQLEAEEIEAAKIKVREYMLKMQLPEGYEAGSEQGVDVTAFIQTPDFEKTVDGTPTNAIDGWQGTAGYNFGNDATQKAALALEYYEKVFDMYQDLEGVGEVVLPNGNYRVTVNAFERVTADTPAYLYVESGDSKNEVELIKLEDGVDTEAGEAAPNDMVSSDVAFKEGKYLNMVGITVSNNKLRIGIKHEKSSGGDWVIMDNFKLIFYGNNVDPESVESLTASGKTMKVEFFTLDGRRISGLQKGITIRKATMDDGTVVVKKVRK